jgi:hypothetical protein
MVAGGTEVAEVEEVVRESVEPVELVEAADRRSIG